MHSPIARFAFAVVLGAYTSTAPAQLLSHHDLSYSIARTIAETAIDSCTAKGYRVSAVVVDRAGDIIVALRGDNRTPGRTPAGRPTLPSASATQRLHTRNGWLTATLWSASK
jgi:hypothetical protein